MTEFSLGIFYPK